MTVCRLKFPQYSCLLETDIPGLAEFVSDEFSSYLTKDLPGPDLRVVVSKTQRPHKGILVTRPWPGSLIKHEGKQLTVFYNPNGIVARARYGRCPWRHTSVMAWLTYLSVYFPLFAHYGEGGYLPIHGGLVRAGGRTFLVVGAGGSGKSGLIATLLTRPNTAFGGDNFILFNPKTWEAVPLAAAMHLGRSTLVHIPQAENIGQIEQFGETTVRIRADHVIVEPQSVDRVIVLGQEGNSVDARAIARMMVEDTPLRFYRGWLKKVVGRKLSRVGHGGLDDLPRAKVELLPALKNMSGSQIQDALNKINY
jgi:hypothetical protein